MSIDVGYTARLIAINASSGAFTQVLGTRLSRRVEIIEDLSGGATGQGIEYQLPIFNSDDPRVWAWGPTLQIYPQSEPIILGDVAGGLFGMPYAVANGPGVIAGIGVTPATPIINIKSAGSATNVRVTEFS
jgi:hypothetical protein